MVKISPRVLVLNGHEVITGGGRVVDAPANGPAHQVLSRLSGALGDNGQVLITAESGWDHLTDPGMQGDWTLSGGPGWHTARRGSSRLRIGKIPMIKPGNSPLLDDHPDLITMAVRHQIWATLTGVPFYGDGGTVALTLLDEVARVRGREPLRKWASDQAPHAREDAWPAIPAWTAGDVPDGAVTLDRNAQYLAGVPSVYVPLDAPENTGRMDFDPRRAGLWEIITPENPEPRLPHPCGSSARPGEPRWYAHPTLDLLARLGVTPEVTGSWTLPRERCRRLLDPWYEVLRDARTELLHSDPADPDARVLLQAVKDTYSRGISHLDKAPERRWYRRDYRAIYYSSARTRMWWALRQAGQQHGTWPVRVATDAVTYAGDAALRALPIGTGIGQWKVRA